MPDDRGVVFAEGYWWSMDSPYMFAIINDSQKIPEFVARVRGGRRLAIQAGGHAGLYPNKLAEYFDSVHTFEPIKNNFECLLKNKKPNVIAHMRALGDKKQKVSLRMEKEGNPGTFTVCEGDSVQMVPLDDLGFKHCDLLWLDVEYYECHVLEGAEKLIDRCAPAVIVEGDTASKWLKRKGYHSIFRHRNDRLFIK